MGISILFADGVFSRLLEGLLVSAEISLLSAFFSLVFGVIFGLFMTIDFWLTKLISRIYLEFVRIMPQLVLLFIMYFGVSSYPMASNGFPPSPEPPPPVTISLTLSAITSSVDAVVISVTPLSTKLVYSLFFAFCIFVFNTLNSLFILIPPYYLFVTFVSYLK